MGCVSFKKVVESDIKELLFSQGLDGTIKRWVNKKI